MKKSMVLAATVASVLTSQVAMAELTANAGVFSNYIWRGVSQTADAGAGQGGIDWSAKNGIYVGTWVSTISGGQEVDVYAGYGGKVKDFSYDVGVISYQYPLSPEINFTEVYASGTYEMFTVNLASTVDGASANDGAAFDSGDLYANAKVDFTVGKSEVSVYVGHYAFENDNANGNGDLDYNHFGVSLGKDGFGFALDKNDIDGANADNVRFTVSYSKDFSL